MSQMAMLDNDNKRLVEEKEKQEASIQSLTQEVKLLTSERDKYEWEAQSLRKELEEAKNQTEIMVNAERERFQKILEDTKAQYEQTICQLKEANEKHHAEAMHEQQVRFDETIAKVTAEMKAATETMLKERQKDFADSSNETLGQIVNPLRETIDKMKQAMNDTTEKQTAMSSEMKVSIEHMMRQSEAAKMSADELARLFKHGTKMQGDWGETVLDEILQSQGLTKGVHYETQAVIRDAKGNVVKTYVIGLVALAVGLYFVTNMAPDFTKAAAAVYAATGDQAAKVPEGFSAGSMDFASSLFGYVIYAFTKYLSWIGAGALVVVTAALMCYNRMQIIKDEKAAAQTIRNK